MLETAFSCFCYGLSEQRLPDSGGAGEKQAARCSSITALEEFQGFQDFELLLFGEMNVAPCFGRIPHPP